MIVNPLKRAIETIQPYLDTLDKKPEIIILDLINERDLGDLAGKIRGKVTECQKKHNITDKVFWVPPNRESLMRVYKRAKKFLNRIKKNCKKDEAILISSYSIFIRALLIAIDKKDIKDFYNIEKPEMGSLIFKEI